MNTSNSTRSILLSATLLAFVTVAAAFQQSEPLDHGKIQTVQISAKRMSEQQKLAYDTQGQETQTVQIVAKRLTSDQKLAMDRQDHPLRSVLAQLQAKAKSHG
jgi:hypothetical protein